MKNKTLLLLGAVVGAALLAPAACSNNDGPGGNGGGASGIAGDASVGGGSGGGLVLGTGGTPLTAAGGNIITCDLFGDTCSADSDCCSDLCDPGSKTCSCGPVGQTCATGNDCCSGQCNPLTNECAQVLGTCAQDGVPCNNSTECCSLSCGADGYCSSSQCLSDGTSCTANSECCGGNCDVGGTDTCVAVNNGSASCKSAGNSCAGNGDCCSGLCDADSGICLIGASYCVQQFDVCATDDQCCGGLCVKSGDRDLGYCTTVDQSGSVCSSLKIAGEVCEGEDCNACCSRTCAPGPAGLSICQPPGGCRSEGELCRQDTDCCGGYRDGNLPGSGKATCLKAEGVDIGVCKATGCNPHGAICSKEEQGTSTCGDKTSTAPANNSCCDSEKLPKAQNPCVVDNLLIPRCDTFQGCSPTYGECATSADCCNGEPCLQDYDGIFKCYDVGGECVMAGGPCSATSDCCVGSECILDPGVATGVCGNTSGGTGGSGNGSGGSGSVCAEYGQSCSKGSDCCNGVTCDTSTDPGVCRYLPK